MSVEHYSLEERKISYQVVRIEQFTKGSLGKIGGETERTSMHHRNEDIDSERTPLNLYFKKSEGGLIIIKTKSRRCNYGKTMAH